jgi:hypothetical protein
MRTLPIACALLVLGALSVSAVPADVTYAEGDASLKLKNGTTQDAQIGDVMNTGDTLRTGRDGQAELNQKGVTIKIGKQTVFTLMEKGQGGQASPVLSVALGSIKFHYDKFTGKEPLVRTNGMVAGIRGTEFEVFSGADGSTLIAVDSGAVTVEAEGATVQLAANEGVEVPLGQPPGDKFTVQRNQVDYSTWNNDKLSAMLADPQAAMAGIETAMASYSKDVGDYYASFTEYNQRLAAERAKTEKLAQDKGSAEARKYNNEVVSPLANQTLALGLNLRYSALAALSLRRFVAGRMYLFMKEQYITRLDDPAWRSFISRYNAFLSSFEESIAPRLVAADI